MTRKGKRLACGVAIIPLIWVAAHCWNLTRTVPKYESVPLSSDPAAYRDLAARVPDDAFLRHHSITKPLGPDNGNVFPKTEENAIRIRLEARYALWPRRIERFEIVNSNEVVVVLAPKRGEAQSTRLFTRENGRWSIWR